MTRGEALAFAVLLAFGLLWVMITQLTLGL
jgi:hypothetical protein